MDRITKTTLLARMHNVNRRISPGVNASEWAHSGRYVYVESRNGHTALDEYRDGECVRTIMVGTKREVADFLHAMMVGIDLPREPRA